MDARSAYRQTSGQSANPIHCVVLLYEQLIDDLRQAQLKMEQHNIEKYTSELGHTLDVVGQLQGRLDMEHGGEVARNLDRFYNVLRARLLQAQFQGSAEVLRPQLDSLLQLREAWLEVERIETERHRTAAAPPAKGGSSNEKQRRSDWSG